MEPFTPGKLPRIHANTKGRPNLAQLCKQLSLPMRTNIGELKPYFDDFLASHELTGTLKSDLDELRREPGSNFPWIEPLQYTIFRNESYILQLIGTDKPKSDSRLKSTQSSQLWGMVTSPASVEFQLFNFPPDVNVGVFDPGLRLVRGDKFNLFAKDPSVIVNAPDVLEINPHGRAMALVLVEVPSFPYVWEFDRQSLEPLLVSAVSPAITRLEVAVDVVAMLSQGSCESDGINEQAKMVLNELTRSPYHFVRWKATQALFKLDRVAGLSAVEQALRDPHPEVRQAANTSWARIENQSVAN